MNLPRDKDVKNTQGCCLESSYGGLKQPQKEYNNNMMSGLNKPQATGISHSSKAGSKAGRIWNPAGRRKK